MDERVKYAKAAPRGYRAMAALQDYVDDCGLEPLLLELVKMRASQINGCAYCIDMHSKDARAMGESEQRLYELNAWRETPFYTGRERAALLWTEEITLIIQGDAPDAIFRGYRSLFVPPYLNVTMDSSLEEFEREVLTHPIFLLM